MFELFRLDKKIEYAPETCATIGVGLIGAGLATSVILFNLSNKQKLETKHYFLWGGIFCILCGGFGFVLFANNSNPVVSICGKPIEQTLALQLVGVGVLFALCSLLMLLLSELKKIFVSIVCVIKKHGLQYAFPALFFIIIVELLWKKILLALFVKIYCFIKYFCQKFKDKKGELENRDRKT